MKRKQGAAASFLPAFACGLLTGAMFFSRCDGIRDLQPLNAYAAEEEETGTEEGSYTIRFHDDFDEEEDAVFTQTASFGEVLVLAECPWEHEGYVFAGWYADGYGVNHSLANAYSEGTAVRNLAETPDEVIELYAGWCRQRG